MGKIWPTFAKIDRLNFKMKFDKTEWISVSIRLGKLIFGMNVEGANA